MIGSQGQSGLIVINGVRYEGPHQGTYCCGLACGIVLMVFGILLTIASIALVILGSVLNLQLMWIIGCATPIVFIIMLVTGIYVMRLYLKKIMRHMNPSTSDVPVVSGYHPPAVAQSDPPPPYPGHENDIKVGPLVTSADPPPYPDHQHMYP